MTCVDPAAPVQRDVDGVPKGSYDVRVPPIAWPPYRIIDALLLGRRPGRPVPNSAGGGRIAHVWGPVLRRAPSNSPVASKKALRREDDDACRASLALVFLFLRVRDR